MNSGGSGVIDLVGLKSFFKFSDKVVLLSELTFVINSLGSKLRFEFLNSRVQGSDLDLIFLSVSAHINAGVRLGLDRAQFSSQGRDLLAEVVNDSLLVTDELSIGNFFLPLDVSFLQELVFSFQSTEGALKSDEAITLTMNVTKDLNKFFSLETSWIDSQNISYFLESTENGSEFSRNGRVSFEVFRKNSNFSFKVLELSLRQSIALSESSIGFQSSISNGFRFFDLKVSLFDDICHGESFFEDGVEHEFMVLSPGPAQAEELALLGFFV